MDRINGSRVKKMHVEIQGGIDMSVRNITEANALFMPAWKNVTRKLKETEESERQKAMEMFGKAMRTCDEASERMMDKHLETVAKSAKELAEYHKRKAVFDRMKESADEQRMINERIVLNRINQRNLLEEIRTDDINKKELAEKK
jgi:2-hydroxy-3-keto-5-methylthiopentenyl-1-phosphate phosphatase